VCPASTADAGDGQTAAGDGRADTPADGPAVRATHVWKSFDGLAALRDVDLELRRGEVHALLGENGAGKTTLCNVLAGIYRADSGRIEVDGVAHQFHSPAQAIAAGIGMVHQHFRLVEPMTVAENVHLGWDETPARVTRRELVARTNSLMGRFGLHIDPEAKVWQLSVGEQQRVEILRMLARGTRILILDEPTAVLTAEEAGELFGVMRALVASGRTVVFISHKLKEVLQVGDRITVLRNGERVVTRAAAGATARELASLMTGQQRELSVHHRDTSANEAVVDLRSVSARGSRGLPALRDVSLSVRWGEILGIAGVSGNGQSELAEVLTGLRRVDDGEIIVSGQRLTNASPRQFADAGVGNIPEDRIGTGLVRSATVRDNAVLRHYRTRELSGPLVLKRPALLKFAQRLVERARVRTPSVLSTTSILSGGNQQRLIVHREALVARAAFVAVHPSRGLDVQAAQDVQAALLAARDGGCAVLLISDDLDEVLLISDRIAVMYEGRVVGEFDRKHADREQIGLLMGGHAGDVGPDDEAAPAGKAMG
jgi:simple sugar transport system ATP-binding protein